MKPNSEFQLTSSFEPAGDQPAAIERITESLGAGDPHHVLLGVTGSGKTFTMAHTIQQLGLPTLVIAPNKTLAAQLFQELKQFFPENAVEFFISYYDYYQPEAYVPSTDTYIAKDSSINDDIDKMRHSATQSLFSRRDVVIVASVSCLYGLGSPESYAELVVSLSEGEEMTRDELLRKLIDIQYSRNDVYLKRGHFRVRGDVVDIMPSNEKDRAIRIELFGDEIERIHQIDALTGKVLERIPKLSIFPNSHYVTHRKDVRQMVKEILKDLGARLRELRALGKFVEFQRLEQRVMQDVEMLEQLGWCTGIENYSRYLTGLPPGHPPPTLLDYFPKENFLIILDESHITLPQIRGMYRGDVARKQVLVDFGFRLPAALDNRPLSFDEFLARTDRILHVSATPGPWEVEASGNKVTEQIIRPTGLLDPRIEIRPTKGQVDDLLTEIHKAIENKGRVLITTLTKRMAEDLSHFYSELGISVKYLHADIDSLERVEILRALRKGEVDVIVGINLLREGLDLPEVVLVAVMDADKEGFLRSQTSLIQTVGRAARNADSRVLFYADQMTDSMRDCIAETDRRRKIQEEYNTKNGIEPKTIIKELPQDLRVLYGLVREDEVISPSDQPEAVLRKHGLKDIAQVEKAVKRKSKQMEKAAGELNFELAAELRDTVEELKGALLALRESSG